jgi:TonB family protein
MTATDFDAVARAILTVLADAAVRGLVLAVLVGAVLVAFGVRGAGDRLAAWRLVLAAALAMPLIGLVIPDLPLLVPSFPDPASAVTTSAGTAAAVPAAPFAAGADAGTPGATAALTVLAIYVLGVGVLGLRTLRGCRAVRTVARTSHLIKDEATRDHLARLCRRLGLSAVPRLAEVDDETLEVPVTFGIRQPSVLLPASWRRWPASKLGAVLIHELSHIRRRDTLTLQLAVATRAIFWPSPLGWWLCRQVSRLAEQASDEAALESGVDPARYAGILLGFMKVVHARPRRAGAYLAMARAGGAERRVEHVLRWQESPLMTLSTRSAALFAIAVFGLVALVSTVRPVVVSAEPVLAPDAPLLLRQLPPPPPPTPAEPPPLPLPQPPHTELAPPPSLPVSDLALPPPLPLPPPPPPLRDLLQQVSGDDFATGAYITPGTRGLTPPEVLRRVHPKYTSEAMRAKIQGTVFVQIVVDTDGNVEKARVIHGLEPGLDEQALIAAEQWTFKPGVLDGKAVRVTSVLVLEFRLH